MCWPKIDYKMKEDIVVKREYGLKRLFRKFILIIQKMEILPGQVRTKLLRLAGMEIGENTYIGSGVFFDGLYPHLTKIGKGCTITSGTRILTHYYVPNGGGEIWIAGQVTIGDGVFIGMNTIVCKSVTIGDNAVVGAGSIITKDIPANELWAGNPARFIRKL